MALKIKRDKPKIVPKRTVSAAEPKLACGHLSTDDMGEGCWKCHAVNLAKKFYRDEHKSRAIPIAAPKKENQKMALKIKKDVQGGASTLALAKKLTKALAKPKAKSKAKSSDAPIARTQGRSLKLGVNATWVHLFQENEKSSRKRTDADITTFLKKEFPDRKSKVFESVSTVRSRYNNGVLTQGTKPKVQSDPHNDSKKKSK